MTARLIGGTPYYFSVYKITGDPKPYQENTNRMEIAIGIQAKQYKGFADSLPAFKSFFETFNQINQSTYAFHKAPNNDLYSMNALTIISLFKSFSKLDEIPTCVDYYKSKYPENEILKQKRGFRNIKLGESFQADGFDRHNNHDSNGDPLETEYGKNNSLRDMHDSLVGFPIYSITVRTYKDQVSYIDISVGEEVDADLITAAIEKNFGKPIYSSLEYDNLGGFYGRKRFLGGDYVMDFDNRVRSLSLKYYWVTAYKNMEEETKQTAQDKRQAEIDSRKKRIDQSTDQF